MSAKLKARVEPGQKTDTVGVLARTGAVRTAGTKSRVCSAVAMTSV